LLAPPQSKPGEQAQPCAASSLLRPRGRQAGRQTESQECAGAARQSIQLKRSTKQYRAHTSRAWSLEVGLEPGSEVRSSSLRSLVYSTPLSLSFSLSLFLSLSLSIVLQAPARPALTPTSFNFCIAHGQARSSVLLQPIKPFRPILLCCSHRQSAHARASNPLP
jgi:hypothetical protein